MQWVNLLAQIPRPRSRSLSGTLPGTLKIDIPHCHTLSSHCVILEYTSGVQPDDRSLLLDASHSMLSTGQSLVSLPIPAPCHLPGLPWLSPTEFASALPHLHGFTRLLNVPLLKRASYPQLSIRSCEASHNLRLGTVLSVGSKWGLPDSAGVGL